ncbi:hypothetical protein DF186_22130, partial [Enterococcus hirae]
REPPAKPQLYEPKLFPILSRKTGNLESPGRNFWPLSNKLRTEIEKRIDRVHHFVKLSRDRNNRNASKGRKRIQYVIGDWVL